MRLQFETEKSLKLLIMRFNIFWVFLFCYLFESVKQVAILLRPFFITFPHLVMVFPLHDEKAGAIKKKSTKTNSHPKLYGLAIVFLLCDMNIKNI